jgi:hypothetical protein
LIQEKDGVGNLLLNVILLLFSILLFTNLLLDLEELTHQVGNYKKYPVFVKMLISGISGDSENVYVNLLTYNDLQLLKARKLGAVSSSFSSTQSTTTSTHHQSQSKRYVILTYASEFDRVNFPLPLAYEENPSVQILQKTIKRLRNKLKEAQTVQHTPKERYNQSFTLASHILRSHSLLSTLSVSLSTSVICSQSIPISDKRTQN